MNGSLRGQSIKITRPIFLRFSGDHHIGICTSLRESEAWLTGAEGPDFGAWTQLRYRPVKNVRHRR
jgi:hypothetical protein